MATRSGHTRQFAPVSPARSSPQRHNAVMNDPITSSTTPTLLEPVEDGSPDGARNHETHQNDASQVSRRKSTRVKAPVTTVNSAPRDPVTHQAPRKQQVEFLRAPQVLVSVFREARTAYHDAVYAWWYSVPRRRDEKPTAGDMERAKADPRVRLAGRLLNEADAELTRWGTVVKTSTLMGNGRVIHGRIRDEEVRLDKEQRELYKAREEQRNKLQPTEGVASAPDDEDARPAKRRRVGASRSVASTSTSRASTQDTTMTTPEPDLAEPKPDTARPARLKRKRSSRK